MQKYEGDLSMKENKKKWSHNKKKSPKIIIIGTGFGGLAAAIRLKQEGEHDFILLERDADLGGV